MPGFLHYNVVQMHVLKYYCGATRLSNYECLCPILKLLTLTLTHLDRPAVDGSEVKLLARLEGELVVLEGRLALDGPRVAVLRDDHNGLDELGAQTRCHVNACDTILTFV